MLYQPGLYDGYQQMHYLILHDVILYTWVQWIQQDARDVIAPPREIHFDQTLLPQPYMTHWFATNYRDFRVTYPLP